MNYDKTKKTLDKLSDLLFKMKPLAIQIKTVNEYNLKNSISELEINVRLLIDQKLELEWEFNRIKREL